ncbi:hypothetical protein CC85DRAFT_135202 [Cutaneotrichosporon oleaginosum]|uniref:Uncharacterized protein n=1 Tax=Cutaneotrichosporon oleaginosum TaxID=879819 RepID=A0A0J0XWK9_9TREE|nr:uncharacterized protein CC85DRAFT_135202 [Cutaneotrichosporon oleaginosum]KLT45450.1 hypothetical protein CC85DRAFT_135202 [Cutaneotrichosporon oleaginosum]TXT14591.1 hypothetical protein COLE_00784 [Cutaneotrichosporon oleaginosum]
MPFQSGMTDRATLFRLATLSSHDAPDRALTTLVEYASRVQYMWWGVGRFFKLNHFPCGTLGVLACFMGLIAQQAGRAGRTWTWVGLAGASPLICRCMSHMARAV